MTNAARVTVSYANNRAEVSHQQTRQREAQMRRFKSTALNGAWWYTASCGTACDWDGTACEPQTTGGCAPDP